VSKKAITSEKITVLCAIGTRPEMIKMAPVVRAFDAYGGSIDCKVLFTAQHRDMLDQMARVFDIEPDIDLNLMEEGQSVAGFAGKALSRVDEVLKSLKPHYLLVQGDTTTVFISALVAFYHKIKVGHVEAGLRSFDRYNPFPEEMNRHLTGVLTDFHFAPTEVASQNLLNEGVRKEAIFITGNPVVDAFEYMRTRNGDATHSGFGSLLGSGKKIVVVTVHRRESFGEPILRVCTALKQIVSLLPDLAIVLPVHPNPRVKQVIHSSLEGIAQIHLIEPVDYMNFVTLLNAATLILTDSGGIQEESSVLGKPVIILREVTERPEVVDAGMGFLVGTDIEMIVSTAKKLLVDEHFYNRVSQQKSLFGDGHAGERIAGIIARDGGVAVLPQS
jgi:UDP-N-acetylglucosamine 2-epimerase (non-hydrolysing)